MKKYYFEKEKCEDGIHLLATRGGWTNEYTPDGEVDTSIEFTAGEKITQEEAEKILNEYDWEICSECGNIFPGGGDCEDCLYQDYKKEEDKKK